jgi:hypothetical protein
VATQDVVEPLHGSGASVGSLDLIPPRGMVKS